MNEDIKRLVFDSGKASEMISMRKRCYYSINHVQSSALFARSSRAIENSWNGKFSDELFAQHRAYVTGSIFAGVSFLEATINELFADTIDNPDGVVKRS